MPSLKCQLSFLLLSLILITSCKNEVKTREVPLAKETMELGDNSKTSVDWKGQYKGTLPCADCEGIATTITLKSDGSFQRVVYYRGKSEQAQVDRGSFNWDDSGSTISLDLSDGRSQSYKVGENQLVHLDQDEQLIEGDLANLYILIKNHMDTNLENKTWVLTELMGQAIEPAEGQAKPHLIFNSENAMISGNNGCNRISMGYQLLENQRLKVAPGISTLMACPNDSLSEAFNKVLQRTDNYTVSNGQLQLNKARMAPLAKFVQQLQDD